MTRPPRGPRAPTTPVIYRIEDEHNSVVAIFPTEPASRVQLYLATCYAHIGQHSSCDWTWMIKRTRPPRSDEEPLVERLAQELRSIGYADLQRVQRWTAAHDDTRRQRIHSQPMGAVIVPGQGKGRAEPAANDERSKE